MTTATATQRKMVTAVFRDRRNASAVYDWLKTCGYSMQDINVLMADSTKAAYFSENKPAPISASTHASEGIATGGAIGTAVGAIAAAVAAVGTSLVIPGLGLVIAGPIAAALAGGGAGAVTGGAIGGLIGLGIPESNVSAYELALREGGVAIGVVPHKGEESKIMAKFKEMKGENIVTA